MSSAVASFLCCTRVPIGLLSTHQLCHFGRDGGRLRRLVLRFLVHEVERNHADDAADSDAQGATLHRHTQSG